MAPWGLPAVSLPRVRLLKVCLWWSSSSFCFDLVCWCAEIVVFSYTFCCFWLEHYPRVNFRGQFPRSRCNTSFCPLLPLAMDALPVICLQRMPCLWTPLDLMGVVAGDRYLFACVGKVLLFEWGVSHFTCFQFCLVLLKGSFSIIELLLKHELLFYATGGIKQRKGCSNASFLRLLFFVLGGCSY